jgi:D-alanyl-lipoteichoic acid acyltransferase DltB (MBOAT superfamily)
MPSIRHTETAAKSISIKASSTEAPKAPQPLFVQTLLPYTPAAGGGGACLFSISFHNLSFVDPAFLGIFLPIVATAFYLLASKNLDRFVPALLIVASLLFYASWGLKFFIIFTLSMLGNFHARRVMMHPAFDRNTRRTILTGIIAANLACIIYFKYFGMLLGAVRDPGVPASPNVAIPLGISFYTFQEITLAIDSYRGAYLPSFARYILFISFFPHLVAGPLVHHREMMPQFKHFEFQWYNILWGISLIVIGLFKKTCLADPLVPLIQPVFDGDINLVTTPAAWIATLAYGMELYFDFSGYSDMALGMARLFGIRLPINFNSPYKAISIIDFWRRWHLTLSRFLREYLYIPLGGNRLGGPRRYLNLMTVMLIGGLWHGANWTFLIWGGLHGFFLAINHAFIAIFGAVPRLLGGHIGRALTFVCVTVAWVVFRAPSIGRAKQVWLAMAGFPTTSSDGASAAQLDPTWSIAALWLISLYLFTQLLPNSMQIMRALRPFPGPSAWAPRPTRWLRWRPSALWMAAIGALAGLSLSAGRQLPIHFLYWNF